MRLIDADSLIENINEGMQGSARKYIKFFHMAVNDEPTAEIVEQLENCGDTKTFMYSKEEGILYEVEADVWARIKDGTETEIKIAEVTK